MTEPYTPRLDEAREVYAQARYHRVYLRMAFHEQEWAENRAEFDRMIEAVRAEEREKAAQIAEELDGHPMAYIAARIREQGKEQGA